METHKYPFWQLLCSGTAPSLGNWEHLKTQMRTMWSSFQHHSPCFRVWPQWIGNLSDAGTFIWGPALHCLPYPTPSTPFAPSCKNFSLSGCAQTQQELCLVACQASGTQSVSSEPVIVSLPRWIMTWSLQVMPSMVVLVIMAVTNPPQT